tara:strand:- start:159 stop:398 length:240 start_codon:yes stop_codon:yes gene_type:complete
MDFLSFALGVSIGIIGVIAFTALLAVISARNAMAYNKEVQAESAKIFSESFRKGFERAMKAKQVNDIMQGKKGDDEPTH